MANQEYIWTDHPVKNWPKSGNVNTIQNLLGSTVEISGSGTYSINKLTHRMTIDGEIYLKVIRGAVKIIISSTINTDLKPVLYEADQTVQLKSNMIEWITEINIRLTLDDLYIYETLPNLKLSDLGVNISENSLYGRHRQTEIRNSTITNTWIHDSVNYTVGNKKQNLYGYGSTNSINGSGIEYTYEPLKDHTDYTQRLYWGFCPEWYPLGSNSKDKSIMNPSINSIHIHNNEIQYNDGPFIKLNPYSRVLFFLYGPTSVKHDNPLLVSNNPNNADNYLYKNIGAYTISSWGERATVYIVDSFYYYLINNNGVNKSLNIKSNTMFRLKNPLNTTLYHVKIYNKNHKIIHNLQWWPADEELIVPSSNTEYYMTYFQTNGGNYYRGYKNEIKYSTLLLEINWLNKNIDIKINNQLLYIKYNNLEKTFYSLVDFQNELNNWSNIFMTDSSYNGLYGLHQVITPLTIFESYQIGQLNSSPYMQYKIGSVRGSGPQPNEVDEMQLGIPICIKADVPYIRIPAFSNYNWWDQNDSHNTHIYYNWTTSTNQIDFKALDNGANDKQINIDWFQTIKPICGTFPKRLSLTNNYFDNKPTCGGTICSGYKDWNVINTLHGKVNFSGEIALKWPDYNDEFLSTINKSDIEKYVNNNMAFAFIIHNNIVTNNVININTSTKNNTTISTIIYKTKSNLDPIIKIRINDKDDFDFSDDGISYNSIINNLTIELKSHLIFNFKKEDITSELVLNRILATAKNII